MHSVALHPKKFVAVAAVAGAAAVLYGTLHPGSAFAGPAAQPFSDQAQIVAAVARTAPSVVAIDVELPAAAETDAFSGEGDDQAIGASGSGFVYSASGEIVTNAHVVSSATGGTAQSITVDFANGDRVPAYVMSVDPSVDIALLKVDGYAKLPAPLPLGDAHALKAGQWAIAIGEPLELKQSVTVGVISAFNRSEAIGDSDGGDARRFSGLLQTSAPINPGNSGGPLIDMAGRVIGINQAVAGGAQGIGFAIPIDKVRSTVASLQQQPANGGSAAAQAPSGATGDGPDDESDDDGGDADGA